MTSVIGSVRDLFADKGNLIDTGDGTVIVQPVDAAEGFGAGVQADWS